jgi:hypothetical protein
MPDAPRFGPEDPVEQRRAAARDERARREAAGVYDGGARGTDADEQPVAVVPKKRGCLGVLLVGCMWTAIVLLVLGGIAAFWISRHWRDWVSDFGADAIKQSIEATELPAQEKDEIGVQIDRLAEAFRAGKLSGEQLQTLVEQLADSPLATSMVVAVIENKYFEGSGLSDAEREQGRRELRRFARATIDGKVPEAQRDAVLAHVADRHGDNWELRDHVSDDDLRALISDAKAEADAANIAEEPEVVDPSDEFKRIVDEALGEAK